jgi:hypothetical protein
MNVDCTLNSFAVPGFSGLTPLFGQKKPNGETISSREEHTNVSMPFTLMRPHVVNEDSTTTPVEVNSVFEFTAAGVELALGTPVYNGCQILIINSSDNDCSVVAGPDKTLSVQSQTSLRLEAIDGAWVEVEAGSGGAGVYYQFEDLPPVGKEDRGYFILMDDLIYRYSPDRSRYETHHAGFSAFPPIGIADRWYVADDTEKFYTWHTDKYAEHYPTFAAFPDTGLPNRKYFAEDTQYIWDWMEEYGTYGINFPNLAAFPQIGISDVIYIADDSGYMYCWDSLNNIYKFREGGSGTEGDGNNASVSEQNLLTVLGVNTVPEAIEELHARINNQNSYTKYFGGLSIGMYLDLPSLNDGTSTINKNDSYQNLRIRIAGFDSYKNPDNTKNHILLEFKHIPIQKQMRTANENAGGYPSTAANTVYKPYLEGGFLTGLLAALGLTDHPDRIMDTKRKITGGSQGAWTKVAFVSKIFPAAEREVFGSNSYGDPTTENELSQLPIYAAGTSKVKNFNGSANSWWEGSPHASSTTFFCYVASGGAANGNYASGTYGVSPCFAIC